MSPPTEYLGLTHEQIASLKTIIKAATIEAVKEAVSEAFKQHLQPITPPEPVTPLQPVIALEQPITPPQPPPEPSSIEKEKETSTSSTSDAKPHQASSEDLYKLQTLRQSTRFTRFAPTSAPAPKLSFSAMMPYQQATFVPLPAYIRRAREMEVTGQG